MRLKQAIDVDDVRTIARRRLPAVIFDIVESGTEEEVTLRANRTAFDRIRFRPHAMVDVTDRDLSTTVLGEPVSMPVLLAPTGAPGLVDRGAELAVARAAGRAGTVYVQSTVSSHPLRRVAAATAGPLWFQLYVARDRAKTEGLVDLAAASGYRALCVTVDGAVRGLRVRDPRCRAPWPRTRRRLLAQAVRHPAWMRATGWTSLVRQSSPTLRLLRREASSTTPGKPVTWTDLAWIRDRWSGPLVVKGIMSARECARLVDCGVDGVVVSNHGGRQLDSLPAAVDVLPEVVAALDGAAEVFVDGGIRRGNEVLKAVALGARACLIGRPYLYGLAAGGEDGVVRVLEILRTEIDRSLALLGCTSVAGLDGSVLQS